MTTTALVNASMIVLLTDSCQLAGVTLQQLQAYEIAPVYRFTPSPFQSPAALLLNATADIVIGCPLPTQLPAGSYAIQLSIDGGSSFPVPRITASAADQLTLLLTAAAGEA